MVVGHRRNAPAWPTTVERNEDDEQNEYKIHGGDPPMPPVNSYAQFKLHGVKGFAQDSHSAVIGIFAVMS